ncbi:MAG: MBL fold metallo-hydrolase [Balneolaceae bacterium]|nr:MBL fold metallo-hydrolase [Balneolaceae bacterium]
MKRRDFLIKSAIMGVGASLPVPKLFKGFQDSPFTDLRRNVGTFTGRGGTIGWLINDDAVVVIDSQYPESATACVDGLKEKAEVPFDMLINTHHHGDHTAGNTVFKEVVGKIVGHENVPKLQRRSAESRGKEALDTLVVPDTTFTDTWSEDVGDETVHLTYYGPAHTSGDSVTYFEKANVAHMGDLMFNRAYPYIDRGAGASVKNWIEVLNNTMKDLPKDAIYIFGHGNQDYGITGNYEDLQLKVDFLEALLEYTAKGIQQGKSKEELAGIKELKGFEVFNATGWRLPLSANIEVAYAELSED